MTPAVVFGIRDHLTGAAGTVEAGFTASGLDLGERASESVRRAGLEAIAVETGARPVLMHQVHGADVQVVEDWPDPGAPPRVDALIAAGPGVALLVRAADCVPLLLADADAGLVAAVHAGREGVVRGVVPAVLAALRSAGAGELVAWLGPHVCGGCYEVPGPMAEEVAVVVPATRAVTRWGTPAIDLAGGVLAQLEDAGGVEVRQVGECTRESRRWPSHRRDGDRAGRFAGVVWRR